MKRRRRPELARCRGNEGKTFGNAKTRGHRPVFGIPVLLRYFDSSYQVRGRPANCEDALLCDLFAHHAVHAAMVGKPASPSVSSASVSSISLFNFLLRMPNASGGAEGM